MADQKINELPTKTAPVTGDKCLMSGAAEEYLIDYDELATAILNKLTSKTFTLDQGTKTLIAAINELNSKSIFGKISKRYYTKQLSSESDYVTLATINLKKDDVLVVKTEWMTGKPTGIKIVDADHDIVYAISENDLGYLNLYFSPSGTGGAYNLNIQEKNSNPNGFSSVGVIIISPTY